ncbi:MAG: hypothetical protein QOJ45_2027 [Verrucomicrobiota bacterium]|jgi:hypothetical protein
MKMKMFLPVVILSALCASPAFARIGETFDQIEYRYGPQVPRSIAVDELGNRTLIYNFKEFTIEVTFVNMRSEREFFVKYKDYVPTDRWEIMTRQEVDAILAAYEADGVKWKPGEKMARPMWWTSEDGRLKAVNMFNQLVIMTVDYEGKLAAQRKRREENKLKGF